MSMKDTHMHALSGRAAIVFLKGYTGISPVCMTRWYGVHAVKDVDILASKDGHWQESN